MCEFLSTFMLCLSMVGPVEPGHAIMRAEEPSTSISDADLAQVIAVTSCDPESARFLLEAAGGSPDAAIHLFLEHGAPVRPQTSGLAGGLPNMSRGVPPRPAARPRAPVAVQPAQANQHHGVVGTVMRLPFTALRSTLGLIGGALALSFGIAAFVGDRVLPQRVMRTVRGAVAVITGTAPDLDASDQARLFIQQFKAAYGDRHPRFQEASWHTASQTASSDHRFLFVYLHAPEHESTEAFCRDVLCDPDLVDFVNAQLTSWGGDIRQPDPYGLSLRLAVTGYPYVALLHARPNNTASLVASAQGPALLERGRLLGLLTRAVADQGAVLVAQQAEQMEREHARTLRAEQDAEYEAALAADREREERRAEERRAAEEEARRAAEEQAAAQAAVEAEERRKAEAEAAIVHRRSSKRASLPAEPPAGSPGCALIRVRLPDGVNASRAFGPEATVGTVFDWVDSLDSTTFWRYNLVSNYPRNVFDQAGPHLSTRLSTAGLTPQAALFVQPIEE